MDAAPLKSGLARLPFRAASFVALVCVAILSMSAMREWSAREAVLKVAEVDQANLARSLTQHAEDSFELLDTSILGAVTRLETDGADPATLSKLQDILVTRKAASKRVSGLGIVDAQGDWLASSGVMGKNLGDREYFRAEFTGDFHRAILRAGIHHHNLIRHIAHRFQTLSEKLLLVLHDQAY